jgi:hypothetical protein
MTGPALADSSRVDDPGVEVVAADFSWRSTALAALKKSSQSYKSKNQNAYCATRCKLTV